MPLMPKRVKRRKQQRGRIRGMATRGNTVEVGDYGIQSLEPKYITARQIEAARIAATHFLHGEGKVTIRIFPDKPITSKPAETRQGKGKGEPDHYVAVVRPGTVLFEVGGVPEDMARQALARSTQKLPIRCRLIKRRITL